MSGVSKFYREGERETFSIHYSEDLAIRAPLFMNLPEPEASMLIRPLSLHSVYIGKTAIGRIPWYWDPSVIKNPLITIIGTPGAGKSEMIKSMIIRLKQKESTKDIPVIIVDPEGEYHVVAEQLGEGVVLNIGTEHYINILDRPSYDISYQLWVRKAVIPGIIKSLRLTRQAALMIRVLESAIFEVYEKIYNFHPLNKETWRKPDPTLYDVVRRIEARVKPVLEKREKPGPLFRSSILLLERLRRWVEGEGTDFFAHQSTIPLRELIRQPLVVFNIKKLPEDAKDMFTYYIFNFFYSLMEMSRPLAKPGLRILLVFDEGWILLKKEEGEEPILAQLFRRARKYGFGCIIATQKFKDVSTDLLPLAGTVVILEIRDAEAVNKLKDTLKIPDRVANQIPTLPRGRAVVSISWARKEFQNSNVPFMVDIETAVEPTAPLIFYKKPGPEDTLKRLKTQMTRSE